MARKKKDIKAAKKFSDKYHDNTALGKKIAMEVGFLGGIEWYKQQLRKSATIGIDGFKNAIEIREDTNTLPKDGQKIWWRDTNEMEWHKGKYIASENMFTNFEDKRKWQFSNGVDFWRPRK